jgi:hypothetical protein
MPEQGGGGSFLRRATDFAGDEQPEGATHGRLRHDEEALLQRFR